MFLYQNQIEIFELLNSKIEQLTNEHLRKRKFWTASDIFPGENLPKEILELRANANSLPNDIKIVLFMNMVTEEGLPMFTRALSLGLEPKLSALSKWLALWTAEEKSHGQTLDRYAFVTNIFQMTAVEKYVFEYLRIGYNPKWIYQPYATLAYALMQEGATQVSHMNVAKLVRNNDTLLQLILSRIAGDEELHYQFYLEAYKGIIELDPNNALQVASHMWSGIEMPGAALANFENYARVANQLKVYSLPQYQKIVEKVIGFLNISNLTNLNDTGEQAQTAIMAIPNRLQKISERFHLSLKGKTFTADVLFGSEIIITET